MTSSLPSEQRRSRRPRDTPPPLDCNNHATDTNAMQESHKWLKFEPGKPELDRLRELQQRKFDCLRTIDWTTLETLGQSRHTKDIIGPLWLRLFNIEGPQYRELCLEFFSTYHFDTSCTNYKDDKALKFKLGGKIRYCSLAEFATRMGLYHEEELEMDIFRRGLTKFPNNVNPSTFWKEIAEGNYVAGRSRSTRIRDPLHRYIHRVIAHSISGRKETTGVVTGNDLFYLYCILTPATCNVACALAKYLSLSAGSTESSFISGGTYITRLAESYDILTPGVKSTLTRTKDSKTVGMAVVRLMKIVNQFDGIGMRFIDRNGTMYQPPHIPAEHPLVKELHRRVTSADIMATLAEIRDIKKEQQNQQEVLKRLVEDQKSMQEMLNKLVKDQEKMNQWNVTLSLSMAIVMGLSGFPPLPTQPACPPLESRTRKEEKNRRKKRRKE